MEAPSTARLSGSASVWKRESSQGMGGGSDDIAEVSWNVPTIRLRYAGNIPGTIGHHWSAVAGNYGSLAWKGLNAGARAMAASAIDLLTLPEELSTIKAEFAEYSKEHPYKPFLPEDAVPPLDLNKELMEKWRNIMEDHYEEY